MLHYINKLQSFNQVSAGRTSSLQAVAGPGAPTYRSIMLKYTDNGTAANEATMKTMIKRVKLKINGTTRFDASGTTIIDVLMKYYGIAFTDGEIVIPLTRPWHKTIEGEENLGWGMRNVRTFEIQVEIDSTATTPTLEAEACVTAQERDLGAIIEVNEINYATAVSGPFEIFTLPRGNGDLVAMHFSNGDITKLDVYLNKVPFRDCSIDSAHNLYKWNGKRTPQTDYVHVDALLNNRIGDVWPITKVGEFKVAGQISAAGSIPIVMETLNTPLPNSLT